MDSPAALNAAVDGHTCGPGCSHQSPNDIDLRQAEPLPADMQVHLYAPLPTESAHVRDNQRKANQPRGLAYNTSKASVLTIGEKDYVQLSGEQGGHFHSALRPGERWTGAKGGEEAFNHTHWAMCEHRVHRAADGSIAVLTVQYKPGRHNPALERILNLAEHRPTFFERLQEWADAFVSLFDRRPHSQKIEDGYLPRNRDVIVTDGSLTTPVTAEQKLTNEFQSGVKWVYFVDPVECSPSQLTRVEKLIGGPNVRELQPLGDRKIYRGRGGDGMNVELVDWDHLPDRLLPVRHAVLTAREARLQAAKVETGLTAVEQEHRRKESNVDIAAHNL